MNNIIRPISPLSYKAVTEHLDIAEVWLCESFNKMIADNPQMTAVDRSIHTIIGEAKSQCLAQLRWLAEQRRELLSNVDGKSI